MIRFLTCLFCILALGGDALGFCPPRRRGGGGGGGYQQFQSCPDGQCQPISDGGHRDYPPVPVKPAEGLAMEAPWADVPEDMRPRNVSGQCAWDAGESVFGGAGYTEFKGWGRNASRIGWVGGWVTGVAHAAQAYGIETKIVTNKDYSIFEYAEKEGVPVYIQIAVYRPNDHAVCLTGLDSDYAYILDNNGPPVVKKWSRRTFDRVWNGIACCPCHRKNPKPADPVPVKPTPSQPKPADQPKPASGCNCQPPQDLKPITDSLNRLVDSVSTVNKSVGTLSDKVSSIDQRLTTAEGKLANSSPVGPLPPPSAVVPDPRIQEVQDKLAKLEANLKQSGTLHITATPK